MTLSFIMIMDIIGTIAFAISGAMVAIQKKMDIFGVNILAITAATGGGVIRDLIIGQNPPVMFQNPMYVFIAIATANVVFLVVYFSRKYAKKDIHVFAFYEVMLFWCDTLGLAAFSVDGVNAGAAAGYGKNLFLLVFVGVVTGVGGGVIRDMMANEMPYIFVKHIYASASLIGALLAAALWSVIGQNGAMACGFVTVLVIRIFARHYKWNLPKLPDRREI